eukprot:COSAG01_NODE_1053_length_11913_cov_4.198307_7_plen_58_part_00
MAAAVLAVEMAEAAQHQVAVAEGAAPALDSILVPVGDDVQGADATVVAASGACGLVV